MGYKLCVSTCQGCAHELDERNDYESDHVMNRAKTNLYIFIGPVKIYAQIYLQAPAE